MKLKIDYKKTEKHTWRLNNMLLNNEIKEEIKRYLKTNGNENEATENLWNTVKAVFERKFIAIGAYLKK